MATYRVVVKLETEKEINNDILDCIAEDIPESVQATIDNITSGIKVVDKCTLLEV